MMTQPPDIDAISTLAREAKARADRATPGQWVCGARWQRGPKDKRRDDHPGLTAIAGVGLGQYVLTEHDGGVYPANDQRFIAAARTDVPALADAVLALVERVRELEREDSEAARYVELPITMRTGFTGDEPYVGWKGLGLALTEALDERDRLRGNAE